jgi:hypothetical protein
LINFIKDELNFTNSEFLIKKKLGKNTWGTTKHAAIPIANPPILINEYIFCRSRFLQGYFEVIGKHVRLVKRFCRETPT